MLNIKKTYVRHLNVLFTGKIFISIIHKILQLKAQTFPEGLDQQVIG